MRWSKAVFGTSAELQTLPCVAVNTDGRVLTGSRRGDLYVWKTAQPHAVWRRLAAHDGPLQSVSICAEQTATAAFATGGDDGVALLWGGGYEVWSVEYGVWGASCRVRGAAYGVQMRTAEHGWRESSVVATACGSTPVTRTHTTCSLLTCSYIVTYTGPYSLRLQIVRRLDLNAICQRGPLDGYGRPCLVPPTRGVQVTDA